MRRIEQPVRLGLLHLADGMSVNARVSSNIQVYAKCSQCLRIAIMAVQITIRAVPEEVRNELAARAASRHQSMQEFLRQELVRIASRPTIATWLGGVKDRKVAAGTTVPASEILRARDADRA